jgi:hypothetical protein
VNKARVSAAQRLSQLMAEDMATEHLPEEGPAEETPAAAPPEAELVSPDDAQTLQGQLDELLK